MINSISLFALNRRLNWPWWAVIVIAVLVVIAIVLQVLICLENKKVKEENEEEYCRENGVRFSSPIHLIRRLDFPRLYYWLIRAGGLLLALLIAGIFTTILKPGKFGVFYQQMFLGVFDPSDADILWEFLETFGLLVLVAFALAPAFKMKFWNIGGEGQIIVGCIVAAGICKFLPADDTVLIILSLFGGVLAGMIWAVIPALFKAIFNTNETLFTLMMNYVAFGLVGMFIEIWVPSGSHVMGLIPNGNIPEIAGTGYFVNLVLIVTVVAAMIVYLKKTKHGYELTVVGESVNTARYIGINVKKVIIRTMILSGGICGLIGFMLVCGHHYTLSTTLTNNNGFTGVLIAWLGGFEPGPMILFAALVAFFQCGSTQAASSIGISFEEFSKIITGMFFLIVIASEFFVNYKVVLEKDKLHKFIQTIKDDYGYLFAKKEKQSGNHIVNGQNLKESGESK